MDGLKHSDKLITKPPTDDYRKGWERINQERLKYWQEKNMKKV